MALTALSVGRLFLGYAFVPRVVMAGLVLACPGHLRYAVPPQWRVRHRSRRANLLQKDSFQSGPSLAIHSIRVEHADGRDKPGHNAKDPPIAQGLEERWLSLPAPACHVSQHRCVHRKEMNIYLWAEYRKN